MAAKYLRILAIDDQESILAVLQSVLQEDGHHVMTAGSGTAGLKRAEQEHPDVILLDVDLPDMDGFQVLQVLRQSPETAKITVILLTGNPDNALINRAFQLGADDYLRKPFNIVELQARIRHRARLKQATDEVLHLQELNRLKEDFLAILSHELRTPLTAVIGFSQLLLSEVAGPLNADQKYFQEIILQRANDLHLLIEKLLELNLLRSGKHRIVRRPVSLHDLVQAAAERGRVTREEKGLHLDLHLPDPPVTLSADPGALQRVLAVLLENAVKFTPEGGRITLEAEASPDRLLIRVIDTGIGIREDCLPVIFEAFRQLEGHQTRRYEGLGVGLYLAKHLVELHGGRIWVESREGQGSTFHITLPLSSAEDPERPLLQTSCAGPERNSHA